MGFDGFPREFPDFLLSLRYINTLELLPGNKVRYRELITGPLTELFYGLAPLALSVSGTLETKPSKCVSTMYTDMRFSRETPLKEYMYIRFREQPRERDVLGLYFDMGRESYSCGIRIYGQTSAGMDRIRNAALARSVDFARELERADALGMVIFGERFKKDHFPGVDDRGGRGDRLLKDFLNMRNFHIGRDRAVGESVFGPGLMDEIAEIFCGAKGLFWLLKEALYAQGR